MVDKINKIKEEINKADLPVGDYMDMDTLWDILRCDDISLNDVLEGFVKMTNTVLNIRAIIEN